MTHQYPQGSVFYRNLHYSYPLITHGQGAYLFDADGRRYLDACGGAAVVNIGHGVRELGEALSIQAQKAGYLNGTQFTHAPVEALAERISDFLPFPGGKVYFLTSGSEAIEASIKLARQYWVEMGQESKYLVISRKPSYHGNTLAALSLSAREHYRKIYQPLLSESHMIPAPYCYRCYCHKEYPSCQIECAYELEKMISTLGKQKVSAFLTEVIGGSSTGAAVPPPEYFSIIRRICDEYEVLLIADEILTGAGRTGRWLACQHFGLAPDIIVMGKGLTSGYFPLSALGVTVEIVESIFRKGRSFIHAQTFAHNPLGCVVALTTLDYIKNNNLMERCNEEGKSLLDSLSSLRDHLHVGDIRGKGLLIGIEFVLERESKKPFSRKKRFTENFVVKALEKGLVLWPNTGHANGVDGDLVLLAPPFIIGQEEISQILMILRETLSEFDSST